MVIIKEKPLSAFPSGFSSLRKGVKSAVNADAVSRRIDEEKKSAIYKAGTYEEFEQLVDTCTLTVVTRGSLTEKVLNTSHNKAYHNRVPVYTERPTQTRTDGTGTKYQTVSSTKTLSQIERIIEKARNVKMILAHDEDVSCINSLTKDLTKIEEEIIFLDQMITPLVKKLFVENEKKVLRELIGVLHSAGCVSDKIICVAENWIS